jgi:hypothetical protein
LISRWRRGGKRSDNLLDIFSWLVNIGQKISSPTNIPTQHRFLVFSAEKTELKTSTQEPLKDDPGAEIGKAQFLSPRGHRDEFLKLGKERLGGLIFNFVYSL